MSDVGINDPLETIVGDALRADALAAPALADHWSDAPAMSTAPPTRPKTRWVPALFGAAAAVLLVVALVVIAGQRHDDAPATAPLWTPPGSEFVSSDLGPATTADFGPVVAALTRQVGIEGHPPQVISTSVTYLGNATAVEQVCTSEEGSAGCRPDWNPSTWSTSITSSVDNGSATFDLWTIEGLPADTAFVSYADGEFELWQRPIMGFAAFPNVPGTEEIVIAYTAEGTEIARFGAEQQAASVELSDPVPAHTTISTKDSEELHELTMNSMRACLTARGGTLDGDVATFAPEVDPVAVWEQCVAETKRIVGDAVEQLEPSSDGMDFARTDITLAADGWERTRFTPGEGDLIGPEAEFFDAAGRSLQVNIYPGGAEAFAGRTAHEFPPEAIRTLDEFEQVATYPSGDRFRYDVLVDDILVEVDGSGFDDVESFLQLVAVVTTSEDR